MYDSEGFEGAIGDIDICRYDGVKIGLEKIRANEPETLSRWLDTYDLDCYRAMSEWIEIEDAVQRVIDDMPAVADIGAEFVEILLPQRARYDDATVEEWLSQISDAAVDAGVRPVVHHYGANLRKYAVTSMPSTDWSSCLTPLTTTLTATISLGAT